MSPLCISGGRMKNSRALFGLCLQLPLILAACGCSQSLLCYFHGSPALIQACLTYLDAHCSPSSLSLFWAWTSCRCQRGHSPSSDVCPHLTPVAEAHVWPGITGEPYAPRLCLLQSSALSGPLGKRQSFPCRHCWGEHRAASELSDDRRHWHQAQGSFFQHTQCPLGAGGRAAGEWVCPPSCCQWGSPGPSPALCRIQADPRTAGSGSASGSVLPDTYTRLVLFLCIFLKNIFQV